MKEISEFGVTEVLIAFGSIVFWCNVAYFGFIRRIERQEEKQDQQRISRIERLVSSVPNDYRNELVRAVREVREGDADISTLVLNFPSEYQSNIAITLAETNNVKHPYILEKFLRDYTA